MAGLLELGRTLAWEPTSAAAADPGLDPACTAAASAAEGSIGGAGARLLGLQVRGFKCFRCARALLHVLGSRGVPPQATSLFFPSLGSAPESRYL